MAKCVTNIVDEDVNPAEFLDGRSDCSIDSIVIANVGHLVNDLAAHIEGLKLLL